MLLQINVLILVEGRGGMGKADFIEWIKADFREWSKADSTIMTPA